MNIQLNNNYFENIDTEKKAYFLGLITADGCIFKNSLIIYLQEEDGYILEELIKELNYGKVNFKKRVNERCKNQKYVQITSKKLIQDLKKYGIIPNKSHKTYFPEISEKFYSHFIRGVFDGDGSISCPKNKSNFTFNICGNYELISGIQKILVEKCKLNFTKLSVPKKSCPNINVVIYGGNRQCLKIKNFLYENANIFLTRKQIKFNNINLTWGNKKIKILKGKRVNFHHTQEAKDKISKANKGKTVSEKTKQALLAFAKSDKNILRKSGGDSVNAIKVINTETNKIFNSIMECANSLNINRYALASRIRRNSNRSPIIKIIKKQ